MQYWFLRSVLLFIGATLLATSNGAAQGHPSLSVQSGHTSEVRSITYSGDGRLIATAGERSIKIWDAMNHAELRTIAAHNITAEAIVFSPDGKTLVSAGSDAADKYVKSWDVASGKLKWSSKESYPPNGVRFSPDGKLVISSGIEINIRDASTGNIVRTISPKLEAISTISIAGDGAKVAAGIGNNVFVWDVSSGKQLKVLRGHKTPVNSVAFSPDSKGLVSSANVTYPETGDYLKLWDVETGRESAKLDVTNDSLAAATFSPDGKTIAAGSHRRSVYLWNAETGQQMGVLSKPTPSYLAGVRSLAFSPDGTRITAGTQDQIAVVWDLGSGAEVGTLGGGAQQVRALAYSPDGKSLAIAGDDHRIRVWDLISGSEVRILPEELTGVSALAFSPDSSRLLAGGIVGELKEWNVKTGELRLTIKAHNGAIRQVAYSPDAKAFGSASADKTVKIWEATDGKELRTLNGHTQEVFALSFSPDGKTIACSDGKWAGSANLKMWNAATGEELSAPGAKKWKGEIITQLAFSTDGKTLIAESGDRVMSWDVSTGEEKETYGGFTGSVQSIAIDKDGNISALRVLDGHLRAFNVNSGRQKNLFNEHSGEVKSAAFSPDQKMAAVAADDKTLRLWDFASGNPAKILTTLNDTVDAVAFSNNGKVLAFEGDNYTIRLWSTESHQEIRSVKGHGGSLQSIAFAPDDSYFAAGYFDGTIHFYSSASGERIKEIAKSETAFMGAAPAMAFSKDGQLLAIGVGQGNIQIIDVRSGNEVRTFQSETSLSGTLSALAFTPDGKKLVAAESGGFTTWEVSTGRRVDVTSMPVPLARPAVQAAFPELYSRSNVKPITLNGKIQFTIGTSGAVDVLDAATGERRARMIALGNKDWAVVRDDGLLDGTSGAFRYLIWLLDNNTYLPAPAEAFFNEFFRPGLLQDLLARRRPEPPKVDLTEIDIRQPRVRIDSSTIASTREVEVKIEVASNGDVKRKTSHGETSGARDLRLLRNGSLVKKWPGSVFEKSSGCEPVSGTPQRAVCKATVTLAAGDNHLSAYAFNSQNVKSGDDVRLVKGADSIKREGTFFVLAVGVDKYANADNNLKYAVADVDRIGNELAAQQVNLKRYAKTEIIKLTNENATRTNILLALKRFASGGDASEIPENVRVELSKINKSQPEDAILFHFSGHGTARCQLDARTNEKNCDRFFLLPHDGFENNYKNAISDEDLEAYFEPIDAGKLLMVIDACNSGQALEAEEKRRGPMNSRGLAQLAYEKGIFILTASQSQQAALETSRLGHGLLTFSLLQGLQKADKTAGGEVIDRSWFNFAVTEVPRLQLDEMQKRAADNAGAPGAKGPDIFVVNGEDKNLSPEKRGLQSPRLFYRREAEANPFVVAGP